MRNIWLGILPKWATAFCLLINLCFIGIIQAQPTPIATLHLDETTGLNAIEQISGKGFEIINDALQPERMPGVKGMALRTNGYSQWLEGTFPTELPTTTFSYTGWFALQAYPSSRTAFLATASYGASEGLLIGLDKFGRLEVGVNTQGISLATSEVMVPQCEWVHIAATINTTAGELRVYLNGVEIIRKSIFQGLINWPANKALLIGADPARDTLGLYPTYGYNGAMDELRFYDQVLTPTEILTQYQQEQPAAAPDLAIPATRFANDIHRPIYHLVPGAAWTNESHGLIYHKGWYHIFHQKNPNGPFLLQNGWGHFRSRDLVTWEEMKPVLVPEPGWDQVGIWSGHAVISDDGVPTIVYTGVDGAKAGMGIAQSDDAMLEWTKFPGNPVIANAPAFTPNNDFRDPYIFKSGATWKMIIGSGNRGSNPGAFLFLFQSPDLLTWSYVGKFHSGINAVDGSGVFWEMPALIEVDSQTVLVVNTVPQPGRPAELLYWTGTVDVGGDLFLPDELRPKMIEVDNWLLAPSVMKDTLERTVAIGIIPDLLAPEDQYQNGWANYFSLPRIWNLDDNKTLLQTPHPALQKLRGTHYHWDSLKVNDQSTDLLGGLTGLHYEMKATIQPGRASRMGFIVGRNPNGTEETKIYYNPGIGIAVIDLLNSSTNPRAPIPSIEGTVDLGFLEPVDIHVFIDGSVIEVFTHDGRSFAARFYPEDPNSNELDVFAEGGEATFLSLDIWEMRAQSDPAVGTDPTIAPPQIGLEAGPNPFHDELTISFDLPQAGEVVGRMVDVQGRVVRTFPLGKLGRGAHELNWDGRNQFGESLASQVYVFQIQIDGEAVDSIKVVKH